MNISLLDKIISILSYFTFGIFSLIWIIFANLTKKRISSFLSFNLYQAIFISIVLAVFSLIYDIAINILSVIPFVGKFVYWLNLQLNQTPIYYSFTITGLLTTILVAYLCLACLIGKKPYIPFVSDIINMNFRG